MLRVCICVCACVLLFLLRIRRLETKLLLLGVDALTDPIHALLKENKRQRILQEWGVCIATEISYLINMVNTFYSNTRRSHKTREWDSDGQLQQADTHLDALPGEGGARLDLPDAVADGVQVETLRDFGGGRGRQQVLLVCKDEHGNAAQLLLFQQLSQLLTNPHTNISESENNCEGHM